ncbi:MULTISPECIES: DUF4112 domain-containing protein [unclassified Nitrobacter]|uniref:DUF4112 domain-containing protein n=1 Tax=unclassified Nitrobacter TaxID=2620411 RepID=UPI00059274D1|nr:MULTISPECIES: DUF4112 domain-containing protein [unclassified Nitrobacter]MCB1393282.1 DUF4112 domain-containing protein [Nitrobacter sp.]MCV0386353.1 DUF4112 domain-containing protein [Nitrobacter sp.]
MRSMSNDNLFERDAFRSRASARAKIIDQDGREIHMDPPGGGFEAGAFGAFRQSAGASGFEFTAAFQPLTREQRLARLDAIAKLLDVAFVVPGTNIRYGIDGLIGLVPVIGDIITTAFSLWLVREARALGAPWHITARMLSNVAVDGVVGLVPVAGDAFDVMFRANMRNVRMLKRWLDRHPR